MQQSIAMLAQPGQGVSTFNDAQQMQARRFLMVSYTALGLVLPAVIQLGF